MPACDVATVRPATRGLGPAAARLRALRSEGGFSLAEVMVSALVLLVGMMGTVAAVDGANARTVSTRAREGATSLHRELVERSRSVSYPLLNRQALLTQLQGKPGLEDSSPAPGYTISRRGFTYEVTADVCSVDDDNDGLGPSDPTTFCTGSQAGTTDRNPDDYKVVTIDLRWTGPAADGHAEQQALVNNPGNSGGPSVATLTSASGTTITSPLSSLSFSVTTSAVPATVSWMVDGVPQGEAGGSGTAWTFVWPISGLRDGIYQVSARAFDANALSGASRSATITLNRFAPEAPTGLVGGRSDSLVELEWLANPERDVVGYRVFRTGPDPVTLCDGTTATTCQDTSPPDAPSVTYRVAALDRDPAGNLREGDHSSEITVVQGNNRPNAPTELVATKVDGTTTLTWQAPSPADPDAGDSIAFYRIYRDGQAFADRYDRTAPGELSYADGRAGDTQHTYWVTAVDTQLAESVVAGPVTL
jgi:Tfp pilus assembly protein PilV